MSWTPKRSRQETDAILCAPGSMHELETITINGQQQRVYKNLWPSLRDFWLSAVNQYAEETYIVFDNQRWTYCQIHRRAMKLAASLRHFYDIRKGDRVAICSRNCPDYLVAFWACHLLGAVSVLANAWLPIQPLYHCLSHTMCKMVIVDPERAELLEPFVSKMAADAGTTGFLVFDAVEENRHWKGMDSFQVVVEKFSEQKAAQVISGLHIGPEDNATIIFTSGTTGLPKGVLSTQRQFLTNVLNVLVGGFRASLRRGEDFPATQKSGQQKGALVAVPLFHVTGSTSFSMMATMSGMKIVMTRKWVPEEAARLIREENIAVAGGVPAMVSDLIESSLVGHPLEGLLFGGSPAPDSLVPRAKKAFPTATMIQGYGMTETNSIAVSLAGEDYTARPSSTGWPSPVNDIKIVNNGVPVEAGALGEVWLRGPNVMKQYWGDLAATRKALTPDGWIRTGDLGYLDSEGFLYIKDRLKDIIIRGGENIDSVSVENALYNDSRIMEAAAVGVPDERLGELVAAVVSVKSAFQGRVTEAMLLEQARKCLPRFAVPVMIVITSKPFELTPSGKIMKGEIRKIARRHWEFRKRNSQGPEIMANL